MPEPPDSSPQTATPDIASRRRKTRASVRIADAAARWVICSGGLLVIVAVALIAVFLAVEVVPLFRSAQVSAPTVNLVEGLADREILFAEADEYLLAAAVVTRDGMLHAYEIAGGRRLFSRKVVPDGKTVTAFSREALGGHTAFGYSDGTVSLGRIQFVATFLPDNRLTEPLRNLKPGESLVHGDGVAIKTPIGQVRVSRVEAEFGPPAAVTGPPGPVIALDYRVTDKPLRRITAVLKSAGDVIVGEVTEVENLVTGDKETSLIARTVPFERRAENPKYLLLQQLGSEMFVGWEEGTIQRYDLRGLLGGAAPPPRKRLVETFRAVSGTNRLTALRFQLGDQSLVAADSGGGLTVWFTVRPPDRGFELWMKRLGEFYTETGGAPAALAAWLGRIDPADKTAHVRAFLRWVQTKNPRTRLLQDWLRTNGLWEKFSAWSLSRKPERMAEWLGVLNLYLRQTGRGPSEFVDLVRSDGPERFAAWLHDAGGDGPRFAAWMTARGEPIVLAPDGRRTVAGHQLHGPDSALAVIACSPRDKGLLSGTVDGRIVLWNTTSENRAADLDTGSGRPVTALQISPKADAVLAVDAAGRMYLWRIENHHGEITPATIFGKVWYEGYPEPEFAWQSSAGTDSFERKFGLMPLIFGTLKGTLYAMLFAVPIAVLAAIYTSEFLNPTTRAMIKPGMEVMASLPSVVLGFIAALVAAPFIENRVLGSLLLVIIVPVCCLFGGYLWQAIPRRVMSGMGSNSFLLLSAVPAAAAVYFQQQGAGAGWLLATLLPPAASWAARGHGPLLPLTALVLLSGWGALQLGDPLEQMLMEGDFRAWLECRVGSGTPLWTVLLLPVVGFLIAKFAAPRVSAVLARTAQNRPIGTTAVLEAVKFVILTVLTAGASFGIGMVLSAADLDPRGPLVGTYVQRNSLVVGFFMGFAVIPIIYTISEDALNAVPETMRSASLGCGATRWQTAVRVVLPTALSGVFSAVMIGLGRAVGETMIVVMATGNTPILDINLFNGFKALSATIAIELPESVKDSTLYRMLFLSGLVLFVMTFVINTVAEVVRQRFRRRAFQL